MSSCSEDDWQVLKKTPPKKKAKALYEQAKELVKLDETARMSEALALLEEAQRIFPQAKYEDRIVTLKVRIVEMLRIILPCILMKMS